jgi:soluble lytic murein transglycosylase-like protein
MQNPRWLIIVGLLIGSIMITGFAQVFKGYREERFPLIEAIQPKLEDARLAKFDICQENLQIPQAVRQWCDPIEKVADIHQLDPVLLAALIQIESAGRPDAVSTSGAVGLMQVMPRDGLASQFQCINGPCFAGRPDMAALFDPVFNLEYGSAYLAGLTHRFDGDLREALKAYGPQDMAYQYADLVLSTYQAYQP